MISSGRLVAMQYMIDAREALRERRTGKGEWLFGFLQELSRRDVSLTFIADSVADTREFGPLLRIPALGFRWHVDVSRMVRRMRPDTLYIAPTSFIVPFLLGRSVRSVPIVHDLIAFRREPHQLKARMIEYGTLSRVMRRAWRVCAVSATTARDLQLRYPFLQPPVLLSLSGGPSHTIPLRWEPDGRTILCIGTLCPRKNQKRLVEAYAMLPAGLRERFRLCFMGGRGWKDQSILRAIRRTKGVAWEGYASTDVHTASLQSCHALVLPSLYEGLGMPVIDAFHVGIPVLTSACGALREVAGDAALFVDPDDPLSIRDGLVRILTDDVLRAELRERGFRRARQFSWSVTVDRFLEGICC